MSGEDARKLISEGLAKLQEGFNQLCEIVDGLETADSELETQIDKTSSELKSLKREGL